ncbi:uncharacterized protein EV154DRAFT_580725 [Mucor mucedo]|uniref:uncharacterized protein n=1 Tax=Mucor mucedo TaxID=29922 RepID=UPI002220EF99|nr:uncharacterized protein EV154DRAFT_580725 [Mucor mucedo]KAI7897121.1 hypothetical protein EV154DRAFT_580725 [Mucor mucedo]
MLVKADLTLLTWSYKIDHTLRAKLNLDHNILTGSAKSWRDIKCVVRDYLDCSEVWEDQPQQFVLLLQKSLKAIITYLSKQPTNNVQTNELLLKEYCSNLDTFYHNPRIINAVKKLYQTLELKKRDEDNLQQAHIQSSATASAMVIEKSRMMEITSKKRLFDEVEDESGDVEEESSCLLNQQYEQSLFDSEDPFNPNPTVSKVSSTFQYSFVRSGKRFDFHTPSKNLISPKKPALNQEDHGCLSDLFDIRLSTDTITSCHPETQETYNTYRNEQYGNTYLKSHEGAIAFDIPRFFIIVSTARLLFMMKISPLPAVGIYHDWNLKRFVVRKTVVGLRHVELLLKDFRASGITRKLHDGFLTNEAETIAIILESSGAEATPHVVDDTYKQLKSSSDFLKYIITKYKMGSVTTLKKVQVPCVSIVENCLTLCLTTILNSEKWTFVEARSCIIPTNTAEKKNNGPNSLSHPCLQGNPCYLQSDHIYLLSRFFKAHREEVTSGDRPIGR